MKKNLIMLMHRKKHKSKAGAPQKSDTPAFDLAVVTDTTAIPVGRVGIART